MNRWYFPFVVGIIIFMFLFLLGDYEMTLILTLSGGFTLGFFLMYWFNRGSRKGAGRR
ncbi:hypothetical protein [Bacillus sp. es.034]|jgi:hypothetical protein|uniref:hypothetical protein n=1 Tax=Bacillus sp. es.034 TaxID=1761763 RepID=UPI000C003D26|nr:hypothetical protein [Bacillus sp. es.034]PFG05154.1 hypothetical protein ATG71_1979 [Bacillus sp. es.034]